MPPISKARAKVDPMAITSQGRVTSQIETQSSSDKIDGREAEDDTPYPISAKD